ncbi:hypothetical protein MG290_12455 [Flavobacterium sp. CBA20B-1]|uniref:hypothetical protein n=1 Tax=unclassified Flavobacterium TaxID=196869 RepID=UPI0022258F57|nr:MULTISPECIES: hypothetical protein [unclassified Flavobacterium]WCM41746.1 hypothetical protein MG290_12455 [Flavobacterium sp. CBA20B-1]
MKIFTKIKKDGVITAFLTLIYSLKTNKCSQKPILMIDILNFDKKQLVVGVLLLPQTFITKQPQYVCKEAVGF